MFVVFTLFSEVNFLKIQLAEKSAIADAMKGHIEKNQNEINLLKAQLQSALDGGSQSAAELENRLRLADNNVQVLTKSNTLFKDETLVRNDALSLISILLVFCSSNK